MPLNQEPVRATIHSFFALALLAFLVAALSGCGSQEAPPAEEAATAEAPADETAGGEVAGSPPAAVAGELEIVEPIANLMPDMGALYLTVRNNGAAADRLVAVSSPIAAVGELHESIEEEGVMKMVPAPDGFEIPPGGLLELAPGGKHGMLIEARAEAGAQAIPVVLSFELAGQVEISVPVGLSAGGGHDHAEMDHGEMDHGETDHGETDHGETDHGATDHEG